jgi:hypothetical protein
LANAIWRQFVELGSIGSAGTTGAACSDWCVCELEQFDGAALSACQTDPSIALSPGFCYVDLTENPGSEALLSDCPDNQKRRLRFFGVAGPDGSDQSHWFIGCRGTTLQ